MASFSNRKASTINHLTADSNFNGLHFKWDHSGFAFPTPARQLRPQKCRDLLDLAQETHLSHAGNLCLKSTSGQCKISSSNGWDWPSPGIQRIFQPLLRDAESGTNFPLARLWGRDYLFFMHDYRNIITLEPGKRGGKPCIRHMRITVYDILGWLAAGMTAEQIVTDYPELTKQDVQAALAFAADRDHHLVVGVA